MPTPKILLRKPARADGTFPLYLQLYINRKKIWIPLKLYVLEGQFEEVRQRITKHPQVDDLNLIIQKAM